ncbi:Trypsin-like peptidase domain-containing protein [Lutibacter agarilyticus]|uniref:Trypsin-like peptidase domain-containing protein n=1 Tax=Lutibacter agarilyticus TaxID=1109740 RepID=A0A238V826_9FLAO|nr:serine protease [Lutibacter agarilyticus]SNR30570.1 Trypsin-like peptidase domain-containing protein [Lutibacter agarilyticus]
MKKYYFIFLILISISCQNQEKIIEKEPWIKKTTSQWPNFALTNTIKFTDTIYQNIANSFLVDTGFDTIAVTCKHIFLVFKSNDLSTIDLGSSFVNWRMYPKGQNEKDVQISQLINKNSNELVGEFNTLKNRDWIIFKVKQTNSGIYPLKIRTTPLKKGEFVYSVGWGHQQNSKLPLLIKMKMYKNLGNYYYILTETKNINPVGRSGSPVIDSNGYLVGIVSGAEGNLGVIGSVKYLTEQFDKHNIKYVK